MLLPCFYEKLLTYLVTNKNFYVEITSSIRKASDGLET